ncbi:MAG: hypothetical protein DRO10_04425 [Thermoprotei archaeon]|nr:MAG: hypothetical protein DRO10_04425 [Thermoprotei archaeon]
MLFSLSRGQADLIAVVLLISVSVVVGIAIAALFVSQSATVTSQQDISDMISAEASNEFVTLIYHHYEPVDPSDPNSDLRHEFVYKLIFLSKGDRDFFLVTPLVTEGGVQYLKIRVVETPAMWGNLTVKKLLPNNNGGYNVFNPDYLYNVSGSDISLQSGMTLPFAHVPIYKVAAADMPPYSTVYVRLSFVAPRDWGQYDLTLLTLISISDKYYELNRVVEPLGGA